MVFCPRVVRVHYVGNKDVGASLYKVCNWRWTILANTVSFNRKKTDRYNCGL